MKSRIYTGHIFHQRKYPAEHSFKYPVYFFALDVDELQELDRHVKGFGYNRFNALSVKSEDYMRLYKGTPWDKIREAFSHNGTLPLIRRVELLTMPRIAGYAFRPVSFFLCYGSRGELVAAVADVNNTFAENHLYRLEHPKQSEKSGAVCFEASKEFHVSPFYDMQGDYEFRFSQLGEGLDIRIDLYREGRLEFQSKLWGRALPLNTPNLIRSAMRYSLSVVLAFPWICWEAAKLHFRKKLQVFKKPVPASEMTSQYPLRGLLNKWRMSLMLGLLSRIDEGQIRVTLPDGTEKDLGDPESGVRANLRIRDWAFFKRVLRDGDVGFGETYTEGIWDTEDLTALLRILLRNLPSLEAPLRRFSWLGRLRNRLLHMLRPNSLQGSSQNIREHYDLSNDFFRLFLDPSMMYSCAYFAQGSEPLEEAQQAKISKILDKAQLTDSHHVLEIGCGWGSFAIEAVKRTGCRVTAVTISQEQFDWACRRVAEEGLESRIEVVLCDYRQLEGKYDRIVSIEMLEAVGHEYLGAFFKTCDALLKPDGWAVFQVITMPDERYEDYRASSDWIQKHIFPGGHLPSLGAISEALARETSLRIGEVENIGLHYAPTLARWRQRLLNRREEVRNLGFDENFLRKWVYYFAYCEAGFAEAFLNTLHLVLRRKEARPAHSPSGVADECN
ncbi:MAG: DUF1365 family protein [Candidatus Omnitrophica bacterium]|nr:DUF1365 family protein [Candidatus Omnitrophota bacterium]